MAWRLGPERASKLHLPPLIFIKYLNNIYVLRNPS